MCNLKFVKRKAIGYLKLFGETEDYGYKKYRNDLSEAIQTQQAAVSGQS